MTVEKTQTIESLLSQYDTISLDGLKDSRRLFDRIDMKYITDMKTIMQVLSQVDDQYDVLEIDNKHLFLYDTIYLDTPDYYFYGQHVDGTPLRAKVRTRHYVDADLTYFEVKLKSKDRTNKYRVEIPKEQHGMVGPEGWALYKDLYEKSYGETPTHELVPQTKTVYKRITLAHKTLPEKVTIDIDLTFDEKGRNPHEFKEIVVVEVKSETKENYMGTLLDQYGFGVRNHCSKYCLSLCYLDIAQQKEYFIETMRLMNHIEHLEEEVLDSVYHQVLAIHSA
ncbi:MAG: polyphosphate polymerase domain-containing protein [Candidatus Peribacteria bacterium]|nr:MAG: polyphosphate polymerase domain-containing protein [Candidatus Peribacteria bacterium]